MKKTPFVTKQQVEEIVKKFPTPFHLYDEAGIRANAQAVKDAFAWNPGFREYFAVKATPNPYLLKILKDYDMGCDCSSYTELMLAKSCGFDGEHIMFSSNDTPAEEFAYADKLGAIINLDDFTHIDFLEETIGHIPETISCRYNPGGVFTLSNGIMDNPGDSKYGMTKEQLFEAFKILKSKGAKYFGVHAFLASNTVTNEYYPQLAKELFELVVELKNETGCDIRFVNLSGGVGVAYKPDQTPNDISVIGAGSLANVFANVLHDFLPEFKLHSVLARNQEKAQVFASKYNCSAVFSFEDFLKSAAPVVVELAGGAALKEYTLPILKSGRTLICLSSGAFTDDAFKQEDGCRAARRDAVSRHVKILIVLVRRTRSGLDLQFFDV